MSEWEEALKPPPISDFERVLAELRSKWVDLSTALSHNDCVSTGVPTQWGALTYDLISFCSVFLAVHSESVAIGTWETQEIARWDAILPKPRLPDGGGLPSKEDLQEWHDATVRALGGEEGVRRYWDEFGQRTNVGAAASGRLAATYKAIFFFVRAYQDATYRVLLQLLGERSGVGVSMARAADNDRNPVARLLAQETPTYLPWFSSWKSLRDSIKDGRSHSVVGPQWNPGVSFVDVPPQGADSGTSIAVRLSQVVEALEHSLSAGRVALDLATR